MQYEISHGNLGLCAIVTTSKKAYRKNTLVKVMYELTNKFYILISEDENNFIIHITPIENDERSKSQLQSACGEMANSLLDQELRQIVIEETGNIRDAIVQKAFSEASKGLDSIIPSNDLPRENQSYVNDKKNILKLKG